MSAHRPRPLRQSTARRRRQSSPSVVHWLFVLLFVAIALPTVTVSASNYYKTLGVGKQSSGRDIKKAFRRLATKYHPDKNPGDKEAHDMFVEINRAYEVLSDEDKRRAFDRYGEEGLVEHEKNEAARNSRGRGGGGIFQQFFGGGGHDDNPEDKRGTDIEADIWLHLEDLYRGHIYDLSIFREVLCPHCFGNGADSDDAIFECRKCGGSGTILERRQIGIGFVQQIQKTCPKCGGHGKIVQRECRVCGGRGVHEGSHTFWVEVQRGTPDGHRLLLENEGDETSDAKGGHVVFHIKTFRNGDRRATGFERNTENIDDLHYWVRINLVQALVGYAVNITHLDGHIVSLSNLPSDGVESGENSQITKPLSITTVEGEGMPVLGSFPIRFGDLHVHFEVVFPDTLSEEQRAGIDRLF